MKLNRLAGILAALMLLVGAFGALAEEPAAQSGTPLYIVLADCGWTLYGEDKPSENSVVAAVGDPDGLALAFAEGVIPSLAEPEAQIMILGYNDRLRFMEEIAPVSVGDAEAIAAQTEALRGLEGRQSSLLNAALEDLAGKIGKIGDEYEIHLAILSGGAVNYGSADAMNKAIGSKNPPLTGVQTVLEKLREDGVEISSYVWDLTTSGAMNANHPEQNALVLTEQVMGEGCAMISGSNIHDMIAGLCDAAAADFGGEEYHAPVASPLASADLTGIKSNDAAVILREGNRFEACIGENFVSDLAELQASAADGDILRLYSAVNVTEQDRLAIQKRKIDALMAALDADQNSVLDAVPEVGAADTSLPVPGISNYTFAAEPADAFVCTADEAADLLALTAQKAGEAKLIVTTADGVEKRELGVNVVDYRIIWNYEDGAVIYAGEETEVAACADPANSMTGSAAENGAETACEGSVLTLAPAQTGEIAVSVSVAGRESEARTFKVHYRLPEGEDVRNITLQHPHYGVQEQQKILVPDVNGNIVDLSGFTASGSTLAEARFNEEEEAFFVDPIAAGADTIVLTHPVSGQTITLNLTVESLFSSASFWLLAAAVPVCMIGLAAMIVLLVIKLGGKRR